MRDGLLSVRGSHVSTPGPMYLAYSHFEPSLGLWRLSEQGYIFEMCQREGNTTTLQWPAPFKLGIGFDFSELSAYIRSGIMVQG